MGLDHFFVKPDKNVCNAGRRSIVSALKKGQPYNIAIRAFLATFRRKNEMLSPVF